MASKPCEPRKLTKADENATTYVTVLERRVVGYCAIAVAGVARESAPSLVAKNAPSHIPCLLLTRLAVDRKMHGCGLGAGLLSDALRRTVGLAESVGIRALLVHARDDPSDPLHLMLPVKDIIRSMS